MSHPFIPLSKAHGGMFYNFGFQNSRILNQPGDGGLLKRGFTRASIRHPGILATQDHLMLIS